MQDLQRAFIDSEKPDWMTGPDFAVLVCLMAGTTTEKPKTFLSHETIASRTGLGRTAVNSALATLKEESWIGTVSGKRQYNSNMYEVLYENLPTMIARKVAISEEAVALAQIYCSLYMRHCMTYVNKKGRNCRRKLRSDWKPRWSRVIQGYLDQGDSPSHIDKQFNWFVVNKPKQFRAGPQGLAAMWPKESR